MATKPTTGLIRTGAANRPHSPVKITKVMTRGLVSAKNRANWQAKRQRESGDAHAEPHSLKRAGL
jgi:hypothetical protein